MLIKVKLTDPCVGTIGKPGKRPTADVLGNPIKPKESKTDTILNTIMLDETHYAALPNLYSEPIQVELESVRSVAPVESPVKSVRGAAVGKGGNED